MNSPDSNLINLLSSEHYNQQQTYFKIEDFSNSQQFITNLSSSSSTSSNCSFNGDSNHLTLNQQQQQQQQYQQQNGNFKFKKANKKKSMVTNEVDEERTTQLVSEILKNIKEKTKELENMNQTIKCTVTPNKQLSSQQSNVGSPINDTEESITQIPQQKKIKRMNKNLKAPKLNPNVLNFSNRSNKLLTNQCDQNNNSQDGEKSLIVLVPYLWKRLSDENGLIYYISPSGIQLKSITDIYKYLTSDNTCKCGLQCPLDIKKCFNFDPQIESSQLLDPPAIFNKKCCQIEHQDQDQDQPKQQLKRKKNQTKKTSNSLPQVVKKKRISNKIQKINDSFECDVSSEHEIEQHEAVYSSQSIQQHYTESDKLVNTNDYNGNFNVIGNDPMFNANNEKKG
jgi:hypothetical protein